MNKKIVPVLIVIAVLAAGGYYLKTKKPSDMMTNNQVMSEANEFAKAMESGKPTLCTMSKGDSSIEYVIKGKMMKADLKSTVDGKATISHMINDTKYLYSWSEESEQGSKIAIPTEEETKAMTEDAKKYAQDYPSTPKFDSDADYDTYKNEGYTIDCKPSSADDSVFVAPSNIKFIDPTEMMKAVPSPDADGKYDMSKYQELQKQYGGTTPPDSY
jgi:hypothetical protein